MGGKPRVPTQLLCHHCQLPITTQTYYRGILQSGSNYIVVVYYHNDCQPTLTWGDWTTHTGCKR